MCQPPRRCCNIANTVIRGQGKEKGVWWISAVHTVPGVAVLKPFRAVNAVVCVQSMQWILSCRWDAARLSDLAKRRNGTRGQGSKVEVQISNSSLSSPSPTSREQMGDRTPLPPPFCQVSSALSSPFSPSLHPRVSLVEILFILHTPAPLPLVAAGTFLLVFFFLQKGTCLGVFFTYLYYKFAHCWADMGVSL